jgi:hypothetical protein
MPSDATAEELWHPARLISTAGIRSAEEQEQRATSALLAVMQAVPEFARALLADLGAPKGRVTTYAEVQLKDENGKLSIPDGAIVVERGKTRWRTLVEVKTGPNELKAEQVGRYLEMARQHHFDAVLTISKQITGSPEEVPVPLDRRKIKRVTVRHLSWWRIMTEVIVQHRFRGVSDPDQAWILGEWIAYLDNEKSGAGGFDDMGAGWVRVRDAVRQGTLRASDPELREVCARWRQFMDYLALGLSQDLGRNVEPHRPRRQTVQERIDFLAGQLVDDARPSGGVRVPDAVAPVQLIADLRARQVTTAVTLDAPREGRPLSRVNWLLRQLRDADRNLRLEVGFVGTRETTSLLLAEAGEYPQRLLSPSDAKREPRTLTLAMTRPMGLKRGKGQGSFVGDARKQLFDFYRDVVQDLKPWQAKAPKLRDERAEREPLPQHDPPAFSAVDLRDPGEAAAPEDVRL